MPNFAYTSTRMYLRVHSGRSSSLSFHASLPQSPYVLSHTLAAWSLSSGRYRCSLPHTEEQETSTVIADDKVIDLAQCHDHESEGSLVSTPTWRMTMFWLSSSLSSKTCCICSFYFPLRRTVPPPCPERRQTRSDRPVWCRCRPEGR